MTPPYDFYTGAESILYSQDTKQIVPYMPVEDFSRHQLFTPSTTATKIFSAWTFYGLPRTPPATQNLVIEVAPSTAVPNPGTTTFNLVYHSIPSFNSYTYGASTYFPTPDEFDNLIMMKAEAETRFCYRYLGGWQWRMQEAEAMAKLLVDKYRSARKDLSGQMDNVRKSQEVQAKRSMA